LLQKDDSDNFVRISNLRKRKNYFKKLTQLYNYDDRYNRAECFHSDRFYSIDIPVSRFGNIYAIIIRKPGFRKRRLLNRRL